MSKRERICSFRYDEANRKYGAEPYEIGDELVRCKECKWYQPLDSTRLYDCSRGLAEVTIDDFCSYGERREP